MATSELDQLQTFDMEGYPVDDGRFIRLEDARPFFERLAAENAELSTKLGDMTATFMGMRDGSLLRDKDATIARLTEQVAELEQRNGRSEQLLDGLWQALKYWLPDEDLRPDEHAEAWHEGHLSALRQPAPTAVPDRIRFPVQQPISQGGASRTWSGQKSCYRVSAVGV